MQTFILVGSQKFKDEGQLIEYETEPAKSDIEIRVQKQADIFNRMGRILVWEDHNSCIAKLRFSEQVDL